MRVYYLENLIIRSATPSDVNQMVHIHMASFQGFFLTFLGARFLNVLYSAMLDIEGNISIVACNNKTEIEGFVVGVTAPDRLYKRLLTDRWLDFAIASILPALRSPSSIPRLLRALKSPKNEQAKSADCLLMSIAVTPETSGSGIGGQLIQEFLRTAQKGGARSVNLTTDKDNNESTNHFYIKNGFTILRTFTTPEGRHMNEYVYNF